MNQNIKKQKNSKLEAMRSKIKLNMSIKPISIQKHCTFNDVESEDNNNVDSPMTNQENDEKRNQIKFLVSSQHINLKNRYQQEYDTLNKLGQGANGVVKKCQNKFTKQFFAVKTGTMEDQHIKHLMKIVQIMRPLKHPNILKLYRLFIDNKRSSYYQVMEYLPHFSLKHYITNHYDLIRPHIGTIIRQLLEGLQYLHKHHIAHRDIKSSNLLYDPSDQKLYIIDLGLISKTVQRGIRRNLWSNTGTMQYKAPQTLQGLYNESVDIWAVGVVLYELVQQITPFKQQSQMDIIQNIRNIKYSFTSQKWQDLQYAKSLVTRLLKFKNQRLSASMALKDPWFQTMQNSNTKYQSPSNKFKFLSAFSIPQANSQKINSQDKTPQQDGDIVTTQSKSFFKRNSQIGSSNVQQNYLRKRLQYIQSLLKNPENDDIVNNN